MIPPNDIGKFLSLLNGILKEMHVYYVDKPKNENYLPWELTYNENEGFWRKYKKFILDEPLTSIDQ